MGGLMGGLMGGSMGGVRSNHYVDLWKMVQFSTCT